MSLGDKLKQARQARKLTPSEIASATRMKVQVVEALEQEDFSRIAAPIYAKGFIKLYAEYVGLDPAPLIDDYITRFLSPSPKPVFEDDEEPDYGEPDPDKTEKKLFFSRGKRDHKEKSHEPEILSSPPEDDIATEKDATVTARSDEDGDGESFFTRSVESSAGDEEDLFSRVDVRRAEEFEGRAETESKFRAAGIHLSEFCGSLQDKVSNLFAEAIEKLKPRPVDAINPAFTPLRLASLVTIVIVVVVFAVSSFSRCSGDKGETGVSPAVSEKALNLAEDPPALYLD